MGGAYAKGFIRAILDYIHTHPEEANGLSISEYDFAPFEPTSQSAYYGVDTYQYSHKNDAIAGDGSIRGAKQMNTSKEEDKGHSLADYTDYINSLPSGNYVFRNGNFIRVQWNMFKNLSLIKRLLILFVLVIAQIHLLSFTASNIFNPVTLLNLLYYGSPLHGESYIVIPSIMTFTVNCTL